MMRRLAALSLAVLLGCTDRSSAPLAPDAEGDLDLSAALLNSQKSSSTASYGYTTIAYPGAVTTIAWGINARGDVVGEYFDNVGRRHGFLLRDEVFTTIDVPGALTSARGISPGGAIVGVYRQPTESAVSAHGFLFTRQGELVTGVDFPGHINTIPQRILPDGTILGCRHDNDLMGSMRGIAMERSGNSEIEAFASMNNGATPDQSRIVGLWTNMMAEGGARSEGYVIDNGQFSSFVVPGSNFTQAWDVNPAGEVVGVQRTGTAFHGFVLTAAGDYVAIDFPEATATRAQGINARGDVVGSYVKGGKTSGFLARRTNSQDPPGDRRD